MTDRNNLPIEEKLFAAARSVEPAPDFSETLWTQIAQRPKPRMAPTRVFARPVWAVAALVLAITLGVVFAGPQKVLAAVQSLFGYLPGIGYVQNDGQALYLAQPVVVEQDGIRLIVEQAVSDANGTVVAYHLEGLPAAETGATVCFYDRNYLRFADGRDRLPIGGGVQGNQARVEFPPLPAGVKHATLHVAMDPTTGCSAPAEWSAALDFGPIPPSVTLMPVVETQPTQPPAAPSTGMVPVNPLPATQPENPDGVQFAIDRAAVLPDGYLVTGHLTWTNREWESAWLDIGEPIQVVDAAGKTLPVDLSEAGTEDNNFTFKLVGKDFQPPLTFTFASISVQAFPTDGASFTIDTGPEPKIGQAWTLDQDLDVCGQAFSLRSIQAVRDEQAGGAAGAPNGYAFAIDSAARIDQLFLEWEGDAPHGVWGQARPGADGGMIFEQYYPDGLPTGTLTLRVANIAFHLSGSWQVDWQPPDGF